MIVELSGRLTDAIRRHVATAHPEEACGILVGRLDVGRVRVRHALPCVNRAPAGERTHRFEIDPRAVLNLQRALRATSQAIVGFYHSHPGTPPEPSRTDLQYLRLWPETVWLIAGVEDDCEARLRAWWLDADRGVPEEATRPGQLPVVAGARRGWAADVRRRVYPEAGVRGSRDGVDLDVSGGAGRGESEAFAASRPVEILTLRELAIAAPRPAPAGGCPE